MDNDDQPSAEVIKLLQAGRKIDAIKQVRAEKGLDLKEAKDIVDKIVADNPQLYAKSNQDSNSGRFIVYALVIMAILLTYEFVSSG